jgi:hypothetical protein
MIFRGVNIILIISANKKYPKKNKINKIIKKLFFKETNKTHKKTL